MEHRQMQRILDHIEENLRSELNTGELAAMAGYSAWHFNRLFRSATGMSPGHYILYRRLIHAGYAISRGGSGIDTALEFGFDTYAGFYRAFVREFGCTPSEYQRSNRGRKPWRIDLCREGPVRDQQTDDRVAPGTFRGTAIMKTGLAAFCGKPCFGSSYKRPKISMCRG